MSREPSVTDQIAARIGGSVAFSRERRTAGLTTEALTETVFQRVGTISRDEARECIRLVTAALLDEFRVRREVEFPFGTVYEDLGVVAFVPNLETLRALNPTRRATKRLARWPNSDHLKYLVGRWRG
jgi:hypothetical protein